MSKGKAYEDAWNETSIELVAAAEAHCRSFIVETFYNTVNNLNVSKELKVVLVQLLNLYGVYTALRLTGDLLRVRFVSTRRKYISIVSLQFTTITGNDIETLQAWLEELLALIRPNAIGIVDSFDIRDEVLGSTLGAFDGNVYERLFEEASKSPLNSEPVNKSFKLYLKPFLKANL
jgi:acyl-CoA oxidase